MVDTQKYGNIFLLISGLVLLIPQLLGWLGKWVPIIIGLISVILALMILFKK